MLQAGWPKPLEVEAARTGALQSRIKGDALNGTICDQDYTLTLTTADQFGNPRYGPWYDQYSKASEAEVNVSLMLY